MARYLRSSSLSAVRAWYIAAVGAHGRAPLPLPRAPIIAAPSGGGAGPAQRIEANVAEGRLEAVGAQEEPIR